MSTFSCKFAPNELVARGHCPGECCLTDGQPSSEGRTHYAYVMLSFKSPLSALTESTWEMVKPP
jgi:hypothetical protein